MAHFYRNVPKLGHVAVSRHAQKRMEEDNISISQEGIRACPAYACEAGRQGGCRHPLARARWDTDCSTRKPHAAERRETR